MQYSLHFEEQSPLDTLLQDAPKLKADLENWLQDEVLLETIQPFCRKGECF